MESPAVSSEVTRKTSLQFFEYYPHYLMTFRSFHGTGLLSAYVRPFLSDKYDITKHPYFKYLSDADKRNGFDIAKYLSGHDEVEENEPARTFIVDGVEDKQEPDDKMP